MSDRWLYAWGLGSVAFGGASLIIPLYVVALGGTATTLGVLAGVAALVGVPGALVFGRIADQTGRRRVLVLAALASAAAALAVVPFTERIAVVILANGIVWFAFAAATPVVTLLAVVGAPEHAWSERIGELNKYQGVGWAVGLLLGAIWTAVAIRTIGTSALEGFLLVLAVMAAASLLAGLRLLPPDPDPDTAEGSVSARRLGRALRRADRFSVRTATFPFTPARMDVRRLRPRRIANRFTPELAIYFLAVTSFFTGFSAFFAPLPAYLTDIGIGSDGVFVLYLVSSVAAAVFFERAGRLSAKHDTVTLQAAGLTVRALALPGVAVVGALFGMSTGGFAGLAVVFAVIGLTWAVIAVTAGTLVTRLAPPAIRGEALGVYAALSALAGGIGSVLG
ncbi:MFS transporter [Halorubrum vacuolatum]|uniref:Major Facilitator Superfamily protein n=1 Tax=Halorubrum vacuolatum TaxID=63740 RepID=A0A238V715_HALVU|nr:MFS transporter [Halorubrum vacuolatum]SNR30215.1 Major Facilitator Superfamily protein [Halorubrum vacuolatum]